MGIYLGARLAGKSHEEASKTVRDAQEAKVRVVKEAIEITPIGGAIDAVEISAELASGKEPLGQATGSVAGDVVSEVTEKVLDGKVGKGAAEAIGGVAGKIVGDLVESGVDGALGNNPPGDAASIAPRASQVEIMHLPPGSTMTDELDP